MFSRLKTKEIGSLACSLHCHKIVLTMKFRAFLNERNGRGWFAPRQPPSSARHAFLIPSYAQRGSIRWAVRFAIAKDVAGRMYRWFAVHAAIGSVSITTRPDEISPPDSLEQSDQVSVIPRGITGTPKVLAERGSKH
jgi:hypothetical protein